MATWVLPVTGKEKDGKDFSREDKLPKGHQLEMSSRQ